MRRLLPALGAAIMVVASVGCARSISEPLGENTRWTPLATVREAGEPVDEFGDGTCIVGTDIEPSTYRDDRARPGCYWARLSGFSGEIQDVIANRTSDFVQTVTIRSTDRGFETGGCGTWKAVGLDLTVPVAPTPVGGVITGLVTRPMPTWPATELLAFVSNRDDNYEIYVMGLDGWGPINLTHNPARDVEPTWSPDGTKIAFRSDRDGDHEIYVMNPDGTVLNLTNSPGVDESPAWSPDGSKIAFASDRSGNYEIYVMDANGSNHSRLTISTPGSTAHSRHPDWSPDGSKIAFDLQIMGARASQEIYVMDAIGANLTQLTDSTPAPASIGQASHPAWSPDGRRIAFMSTSGDGQWEVYVMDSDGSGQTQLTDTEQDNMVPAWSPDGSKIAFDSLRDGTRRIYVMNADGAAQGRLTSTRHDTGRIAESLPLSSNSGPARTSCEAELLGEPDLRPVDIGLLAVPRPGSCIIPPLRQIGDRPRWVRSPTLPALVEGRLPCLH